MKLKIFSQNEFLLIALVAGLILVPLATAPSPCLPDIVSGPTAQFCQEQSWKRILVGIRPIEFLTLFVLIGQWLVFSRQAGIAETQNELIAGQIEISRQAITIARQPQIYVHQTSLNIWNGPALHEVFTARATLMVVGETPASFRFLSEELLFAQRLPAVRPVFQGFRDPHVRNGGESLSRETALFPSERVLNVIRQSGTEGRAWSFFIVGTAIFDDIFGNQHEFLYCYRFGVNGGLGRIHGGEDYNRRRIIPPDERIE